MQQSMLNESILHVQYNDPVGEIERSKPFSWTVGVTLAGTVLLFLSGAVLLG